MNRQSLRTALFFLSLTAAASASAEITLFENENFNGRTFRSNNSVSNLDQTGFNDRASSVVVRGGNYQLCSDAFFRGNCVTVGPGDYPSLGAMNMNHKVSSVRELGWTPDGAGGWEGGRRDDRRPPPPQFADRGNRGGDGERGGNWGSGGRAILFENPNLSGRAMSVDPRGMANLDLTNFNDRASSLRVESGYWIFCSDANFQGECRTFAPGDYTSLPRGLDGRISSGRRVSNDYPYRQNPNWDR